MIRKEELAEIAGAKRIFIKNAEKDYLLELLLFSIFSETGGSLVLKGGTAMYKFYNLNRFSEDLDFSVSKRGIDIQDIVKTTLRRLSALGVEGNANMEPYGNEINARLLFKGPLYNGNKESMTYITLNFSMREKPKTAINELFTPAYREIPSFEAFVMDAPEILAEKVRAIYTRNKARDAYDLWFLLKKKVPFGITLANEKLKRCGLVFSKKEFAGKLGEKEGLFAPDLRGLIIGELPDFTKIKKEILEKL